MPASLAPASYGTGDMRAASLRTPTTPSSSAPPADAQSSVRSFFVQKSSGRPGLAYELVQKLGEGAFGVAHLVRDRRTGQHRVLKTINKRLSQVPPAQLEREIRNMKACDHPHIIKLFEYYEDYENIYLIMERAAGGELHQVLQQQREKHLRLPERWIATVIRQCLQAIAYVHSMGIIHKDLKAENILLLHEADLADPQCQPHAVIIDLGIAELFSARLGRRARCTVVAGTPTHMAPEVWCGNFGPVADVWSLGVVLFELLSGELPFVCSSVNGGSEWIRLHRQGPNWSLLAHSTGQARALCQRMLSCDERMRPTAQQCLGHSWFKGETAEVGNPEAEEAAEDAAALVSPRAPPASSLSDDLSPVRVESALRDYLGRSTFEKAVLLQVASHLHTSQIVRVADLFVNADHNRDGCVTVDEMSRALRELGVDQAEVQSYVACLDIDSNGKVEYTELVSGCVGLLYESLRGLLWQSFCTLDIDGNGVLGLEEVRAILTRAELAQHGFPGSRSIDEALADLDVDGNGQVTFEELCQHFIPTRPLPPSSPKLRTATDPAGSVAVPLLDEEFAQLLDEIEADHAVSLATAHGEALGSDARSDTADRDIGSVTPTSMQALLACSPEPDGMSPASRPTSALSVDEELSHLLADFANGP